MSTPDPVDPGFFNYSSTDPDPSDPGFGERDTREKVDRPEEKREPGLPLTHRARANRP